MMKIVIDLGTTNTKIYLIENHKVVEKESFTTSPLNKEFLNLSYIESNIKHILKRMIKDSNDKVQIIFTGAMHTLIVLNEDGKELTPSTNLLFSNYKIDNKIKDFQQKTGMIPGSHLPLFRLNYFVSLNKKILSKINKVMSLKSYLIWKWTSSFNVELVEACGFGLIEKKTASWNYEVFDRYDLNTEWFGKFIRYDECVKAEMFGKEIEFFYGVNDGVSVGLIAEKEIKNVISITTGTTLGVRHTTMNDFKFNRLMYSLPISKDYHLVGITNNNGFNNLEFVAKKLSFNLDNIGKALNENNQTNDFYYPTQVIERYSFSVVNEKKLQYFLDNYDDEKIIYSVYEGLCFMMRFLIETLENTLNEKKLPVLLASSFLNDEVSKEFVALKLQKDFYQINNKDIGIFGALSLIDDSIDLKNQIIKIKHKHNEGSEKRYHLWKQNIIINNI